MGLITQEQNGQSKTTYLTLKNQYLWDTSVKAEDGHSLYKEVQMVEKDGKPAWQTDKNGKQIEDDNGNLVPKMRSGAVYTGIAGVVYNAYIRNSKGKDGSAISTLCFYLKDGDDRFGINVSTSDRAYLDVMKFLIMHGTENETKIAVKPYDFMTKPTKDKPSKRRKGVSFSYFTCVDEKGNDVYQKINLKDEFIKKVQVPESSNSENKHKFPKIPNGDWFNSVDKEEMIEYYQDLEKAINKKFKKETLVAFGKKHEAQQAEYEANKANNPKAQANIPQPQSAPQTANYAEEADDDLPF